MMHWCDREYEPLIEAHSLREQAWDFWGPWFAIIDEVDGHPSLEPLRADFTDCILSEDIGPVPPHYAEHERSFPSAVMDGLGQRGNLDSDEYHETRREMGQLYARCSRELWEHKIELRLERRDEFLAEHWEAIVEFSEVLHDHGIIAEPLSDDDRPTSGE